MPTAKKATQKVAKQSARPRKGAVPETDAGPPLDASDLRAVVLESANILAPADIETLMSNEDELRRKIAKLKSFSLPLFAHQTTLAIDCLRDHLEGACPQIPYRTIAILGAAVLYFFDDNDIFPDFLPQLGRLDDAAIMATAFALARPGLERYCAATDREFPHDAPLGPRTVDKARQRSK